MTTGHCHCGQSGWSIEGAPDWGCYCHCDDCRRNCAAPVVAWLGVELGRFRWTGQPPKTRESTPGVFRHFCANCGTPLGFEARHYPDSMQLYAASLADPAAFRPQFHVNIQDKLPWLSLADDLPKYHGTLFEAKPATSP